MYYLTFQPVAMVVGWCGGGGANGLMVGCPRLSVGCLVPAVIALAMVVW